MKSVFLASSSPRRKELLELGGIPFQVVKADADEHCDEKQPQLYVKTLAERKCLAAVKQNQKDGIYIGADTIVYHDGQILGKPQTKKDAFLMLKSLSGATHTVFTGVTVLNTCTQQCVTFYEATDVTFYDVTDEELTAYIKTGEPMDKAGAYGIQGKGVFLVKKINGDYNNVVGLPLAHLLRVLKNIN